MYACWEREREGKGEGVDVRVIDIDDCGYFFLIYWRYWFFENWNVKGGWEWKEFFKQLLESLK